MGKICKFIYENIKILGIIRLVFVVIVGITSILKLEFKDILIALLGGIFVYIFTILALYDFNKFF